MKFKKDYINYVLHNVLQSNSTSSDAAKKILERVIAADDFFKITFVVGKTAGLELLFKYLLYISDKVDKSQITVFNLKDNYEYDVHNLKRIFSRMQVIEAPAVPDVDEITLNADDTFEASSNKEEQEVIELTTGEVPAEKDSKKDDNAEYAEESGETNKDSEDEGMSLVETKEPEPATSNELFELETISRSLQDYNYEVNEKEKDNQSDEEKKDESKEDTVEKKPGKEKLISSAETADEKIEDDLAEKETRKELELEIEVRKPTDTDEEYEGKEDIKEEISELDEFNKFEQKYREEIKILEKLLSYVEKECTFNGFKGLNERTIQSFNEIIEISNGLAELTRQLSFDLVSDIFYTLNMYFTKAAEDTSIITLERIKLFDSSLAIVSSLIKGESYLDYGEIIARVESLKRFLAKPMLEKSEKSSSVQPEDAAEKQEINMVKGLTDVHEIQVIRKKPEEEEVLIEKPKMKKQSAESIIFKMKYLIKEFEKNFASLENITGEYSKFTALERIDELNYYLRMLAKIAAAVKLNDILKLAEVSYVFLKYLKDYRMDLLDAEIQQIIKYIIFTFKMLLTDRKPEDFNVLVQYLNNPVKIFADSN